MRDHVIDVYDDGGQLFLKTFPGDRDTAMAFLKTAARIDDIREDLSPDNFALVGAVEGEDGKLTTIRKFALADPGNVKLSAHYFALTNQVLNPEARKVAAARIASAMDDFGMHVPDELREIAGHTKTASPFVRIPDEPEEKVASFDHNHDTPHTIAGDVSWFMSGGYKSLHPLDRRPAAKDLEKRASAFGVKTPGLEDFTADGYGDQVVASVRGRYSCLVNPDYAAPYEVLLSKQASVPPEVFAETLAELDAAYGLNAQWDGLVRDPVLSTFAKTAKAKKAKKVMLRVAGNEFVSEEAIKKLATDRYDLVKNHFSEDQASQFQKNPVAVFKSLPAPTQQIMARLAVSEENE